MIEIDLAEINEPIAVLPERSGRRQAAERSGSGAKIDEVFIGSCMTNIGHFRAASKLLEGKRDIPVKLWVAPPTKMDAAELTKEGHYGVFGSAGARTEMPGCSLCMGNQAQVREGATVVSTSTRNFPNRLGKNTNVFLASAELAAIASKLGPHADGGRVPRRHGRDQRGRGQGLPLHELRPDRRVRRGGEGGERLTLTPARREAAREAILRFALATRLRTAHGRPPKRGCRR